MTGDFKKISRERPVENFQQAAHDEEFLKSDS